MHDGAKMTTLMTRVTRSIEARVLGGESLTAAVQQKFSETKGVSRFIIEQVQTDNAGNRPLLHPQFLGIEHFGRIISAAEEQREMPLDFSVRLRYDLFFCVNIEPRKKNDGVQHAAEPRKNSAALSPVAIMADMGSQHRS